MRQMLVRLSDRCICRERGMAGASRSGAAQRNERPTERRGIPPSLRELAAGARSEERINEWA